MNDIASIDKNFIVKTDIEKGDIRFHDIEDKPFKVYGIFKENENTAECRKVLLKTSPEG